MKLVQAFAMIVTLSSTVVFADTQAQCPDIQGNFANQNKHETYEISRTQKDAGLTYTMKVTHSLNDVVTMDYIVDSKNSQNNGVLGPVTTQVSCVNQTLLVALQTLMGTDMYKFTLNDDGNLVIEEVMSLPDGQSKTLSLEIYKRQ